MHCVLLFAEPAVCSEALEQAADWLRWGLDERRAHLRSLLDVFEIQDLGHPAKRNQVELLAPLQLRSRERGVRALEVRPATFLHLHMFFLTCSHSHPHFHVTDMWHPHFHTTALWPCLTTSLLVPTLQLSWGFPCGACISIARHALHMTALTVMAICSRGKVKIDNMLTLGECAFQDVKPWQLLGEYCGVVKTGEQMDAGGQAHYMLSSP
jgi:hypothetical protein